MPKPAEYQRTVSATTISLLTTNSILISREQTRPSGHGWTTSRQGHSEPTWGCGERCTNRLRWKRRYVSDGQRLWACFVCFPAFCRVRIAVPGGSSDLFSTQSAKVVTNVRSVSVGGCAESCLQFLCRVPPAASSPSHPSRCRTQSESQVISRLRLPKRSVRPRRPRGRARALRPFARHMYLRRGRTQLLVRLPAEQGRIGRRCRYIRLYSNSLSRML
jgi:hypothetical protein